VCDVSLLVARVNPSLIVVVAKTPPVDCVFAYALRQYQRPPTRPIPRLPPPPETASTAGPVTVKGTVVYFFLWLGLARL